MQFFENIFSLDFFISWLSYSTYSIITGSGTQHVSFKENFYVKAKQVFHVDSFYISLMGMGLSTLKESASALSDIHIYRTSSNLYTPDSVSLTHQLYL